jgi:hypothetical protein
MSARRSQAQRICCKRDIALHLFGDAMNDLVDRILTAYQLTWAQDGELVADSRRKITGYIESLAAAWAARCQAADGVRLGLFERAARGARPSVYRLLDSRIQGFQPR